MANKIAQFPKGFSGGVSLRGTGPLVEMFATSAGPANTSGPGVFWVDSVNGLDGNPGTYQLPLATIARGVVLAKTKDVVMVAPNHVETITAAAGVLMNVAGVSVIGLGNEQSRPLVKFTTATTATFKVTADSCMVKNFRFRHDIASLASCLDVQGTNFTVDACEFRDGASTTGLSDINLAVVSTTANAADGLKVYNSRFYHPTAGNMTSAIGLNLVEDYVEISNNWFYGNFSLSAIHNVTGKVVTNLRVTGNYVQNLTAAKQAMNLISACTGEADGNVFKSGDTTVADAVYGSLNVGPNNEDRFGRTAAGTAFVTKTTITSSTLTTAAQSFATLTATGNGGVATGGDVIIDNIVVKSDATGLAGATNFRLLSNNVKGLAAILEETVANLGANKTVDMFTASVVKQRTVLESTKLLQALGTVGAGTGAGTVDVFVEARRKDAGAILL